MPLKTKFTKAKKVLKEKGLRSFLKKSVVFLLVQMGFFKLLEEYQKSAQEDEEIEEDIEDQIKNTKKVKDIIANEFEVRNPLNSLWVETPSLRLNLVVDSLKDSLVGSTSTAIILATLFSNKYGIPLRIINLTSESTPSVYKSFLKSMKLAIPLKVEYFSNFSATKTKNPAKLEVSKNDIFLTTSCWTTHSVKKINLRKTCFYVVHDVEKFFYSNGDIQHLSESLLNDSTVKYLINSELLFDYYRINDYKNLINNCCVFEPAFPETIYYPGNNSFSAKHKKNLFFSARPTLPHHLYFSGLKIIDEALLEGIIDINEWEICFAGNYKDQDPIMFSNGYTPKMLGELDVANYLKFIKEIDLGFAIMNTPHPGHVALDIAACGGVTLTNKYANKKSIAYSKNIICERLDKGSIFKGLESGIDLAKNLKLRKENYLNNNLEKSWEKTFEKTLNYIFENK